MLISTLTSKGQATIPAEIRKDLHLKAGDKIIFEVVQNKVTLKKASVFDLTYHQALSKTLAEWNTPEDDEAYRDL